MENIPMIIDIALIVMIVICAVKGYKDGFFTSAVSLAGNLVSLVVSWIISNKLSVILFDMFFKEKMIASTYETIQSSMSVSEVKSILNNLLGAVPENVMENFVQKAEETIAQFNSPTQQAAEALVENIIGPVMSAAICVVLFVICVVLCNIIVILIAKTLKGVNHIPVIGFANRVAGFGAGLCIGGVYVIIVSLILSLIAIITQNTLSFLNIELLSQSSILSYTAFINPFIV